MTEHDVTNRLPASQNMRIRDNIKKDGKNFFPLGAWWIDGWKKRKNSRVWSGEEKSCEKFCCQYLFYVFFASSFPLFYNKFLNS